MGDRYKRHGAMSDPQGLASVIDGLPDDVGALCAVVQGLLLHDHQGGELYGTPPAAFAEHSRRTLPVAERLAAVLRRDARPLVSPRAPFEREVGTCRDFALMLCAMLRQRGTPARVRCGFADYFSADGWEDHWVCEHWVPERRNWALADAQLDAPHRRHLGIDFDIADVPRDRFLLAGEAWRLCRSGADPELFGHGEARGLWFVEVNLVRDHHALLGEETSRWDAWRETPPAWRRLGEDRLARDDLLAGLSAQATGLDMPPADDLAADGFLACPPWLDVA